MTIIPDDGPGAPDMTAREATMSDIVDPRPARHGWAPGSYSGKCSCCMVEFIGDKRAWQCADCAYKPSYAEQAAEITRLRARVAELEEGLRDLVACHDEDIGMDDRPDDESVGWDGYGIPLPLTFGVLRRARRLTKGGE